MLNDYTWHTFPNIGYIWCQVPDEDLEPIRQEVDLILDTRPKEQEANQDLAGNLDLQFHLNTSFDHLEQLVIPMAKAYTKEFNYTRVQEAMLPDRNFPYEWYMHAAWCNGQKATEFNPSHFHSGILSFVIWLEIPYAIEQEQRLFPKTLLDDKRSGTFEFLYTDSTGQIRNHTIHADQYWQGRMIMFPSKMIHQVYPFYSSQDQRKSVSGNLFIRPLGSQDHAFNYKPKNPAVKDGYTA